MTYVGMTRYCSLENTSLFLRLLSTDLEERPSPSCVKSTSRVLYPLNFSEENLKCSPGVSIFDLEPSEGNCVTEVSEVSLG